MRQVAEHDAAVRTAGAERLAVGAETEVADALQVVHPTFAEDDQPFGRCLLRIAGAGPA